jgi:hypothetical protein
MTEPVKARFGSRPALLVVLVAAAVGGVTATRVDLSTVFFPGIYLDAGVMDSPVVDSPVDVAADAAADAVDPDGPTWVWPTDWYMVTIHGPSSAVGLAGADGVDVAMIDGQMSIVSPWEQSSKVTVSTRTGPGSHGLGEWSTISLQTVVNVEDAKWCDVDGDGHLDVIAGGQGKRIRVWFGPHPFSTALDIGAATNVQLWMQLACSTPAARAFTADASTDTLTATAHGWSTGDLVRLSTDGALPAGLSTSTDYFAIRTGANTLRLATSRSNAYAGTVVDVTDAGSGTHTATGGMRVWAGGRGTTNMAVTADASTDTLTKVAHGMATGEFVRVSSSGTLPGGLAAGTTYNVIRTGADTFKLATTQPNAFAGTAIDITSAGSGTHTATRHPFVGYFQSGDPRTASAWSYMPIAINGWLMSLEPGDYDGDGDLDVLISERQAGCCAGTKGSKWFRSDAGGVWTPTTIYNFNVPSNQGDPKFLFANATTVLTGGSSDTRPNKLVKSVTADNWATWTHTTIPYPSGTGWYHASVLCDITGDSVDDIVITHSSATGSSLGVIAIDGVTSEVINIDHADGEKYDDVRCLDMDGDGDLDVLTSEQNEGLGVIWFMNPRLHP